MTKALYRDRKWHVLYRMRANDEQRVLAYYVTIGQAFMYASLMRQRNKSAKIHITTSLKGRERV